MIAGTASLRDIPLFETSTERSLEIIAGIAEEATFPAGAVVIREGDEGDSLIVIRSGSAVVDQGGRELRRLGGGDFVGEIAPHRRRPPHGDGHCSRADRSGDHRSRRLPAAHG